MDLQFQGAQFYDRTGVWVTGTNGEKIFVERPIPRRSRTSNSTDIDPANPFLDRQGLWKSYYERLRKEAPVHYQAHSAFGPFWSVTRHADIVDRQGNHEVFLRSRSSSSGARRVSWIRGDVHRDGPPKYDWQAAGCPGWSHH